MKPINFVLLLAGGAFVFSFVKSHPARPTLSLCSEDKRSGKEIRLQCTVVPEQFLDFDEIRAYTASRPDNERFNVSINCYDGGKIRLPWPFFAKNVVSIHVRGCHTEGFLSERTQSQIYPNQLKQVLLSDLKHHVNLRDLYDSIMNIQNMSKDFECGHTKAVVEIARNIDYQFDPIVGIDDLILMEELISGMTLKTLLKHNTVCDFPYLQYLEESGSRSFSSYHMKMMEASHYPKLKVLSLRNNSLPSVPSELENLSVGVLPSLSVLDLSDNVIASAEFMFSHSSDKTLLINLKRNRITHFSRNLLVEIAKSSKVILDIRENPIDCSCELFSYGRYLLSLQSAIANDIYRGTTCRVQHNGMLKQHYLYEKEYGLTLCST